jgi:type IV pilus assembly protein PilB
MKDSRNRIGDVLINAGILTNEQLSKSLEIQAAGTGGPRGNRKRLGKILVELNYVSEEQMADALARHLQILRVNVECAQVPDEVIQLVTRETAEQEILIPYAREGKRLTVVMSDPLNLAAIDDLRFRTGLEVNVAVAGEAAIMSAIEKHYRVEEAVEYILGQSQESTDVEFFKDLEENADAPQLLQQLSQAAPIVKLVTTILTDAIRRRATDIHIEPRERHVQVRYRIDGNLQDTLKLPRRVQASVISRIKILASMDIATRMAPQDGGAKMRLGKNHVDLRVSTLPAIHGEKVVIRILDRTRGLLPLSKLGVPTPLIKQLQEAGGKSQGMIVVTGPTGSGKTTTLYAFLQWLQDPAVNIITVEDPVEYNIPGITQVNVREQAGLGFPEFMRSALRQDPDIILVGEIRDLETAQIAIRAALTGHLVLTTVHTNDTASTVTRLTDLGIQPFLVSSSLTGIVAQRLVRKICDKCKIESDCPKDLPPEFPPLARCFQGNGCPTCDYSGYYGQVGIYEYLDVSEQIKRLIASGASEAALRDEAVRAGMVTLFQDAWQKVEAGVTTIAEVMGKVPWFAGCGDPEQAVMQAFRLHPPEVPWENWTRV